MSNIRSNTYILRVPEGKFFDVSVKHYSLLDDQAFPVEFGHSAVHVTLFLAHGIGLHKELYEPFLDDLMHLQMKEARSLRLVVTEAWAIDCPNHGYSTLLNEKKLVSNKNRYTSPRDYAQSFLALIDSGLVSNIESKCLVFVGHSAGATTVVLTVEEIIQRKRPIQIFSLILLECPLLATPKVSGVERNERWMTEGSPIYVKLLSGKQDKWPSKEAAFKALRKSVPYKNWDNRALELHIEHGLRPLPTLFYPEDKTGFTPKCYKLHEKQGFSEIQSTLAMAAALPGICKMMPVHLVFADRSLLRPCNEEIALLAAGKDDKYPCDKYASVVLVPDAGHLILQDAPCAVAKCILDALNTQEKTESRLSRL